MSCDAADAQGIEAAAAAVEEHFRPIDVWVNNAIASVFLPIKGTPPDEFKRNNARYAARNLRDPPA